MRKAILARHTSTNAKCPACGYVFVAAATGEGAFVDPTPGTVVICVKCGELGQYLDPITIVSLPLSMVPCEHHASIKEAQKIVRARWKEQG
jgi:predicted metal-binding protein